MSLLVRPIGVELQNTTVHNGSSGSMCGVCHRNSFCRGFGRQNRSIDAIDDFDAKLFHWQISGCYPNELYCRVRCQSLRELQQPSLILHAESQAMFPLLAVDVQDIRQSGRQGCPIDVRLKRYMKGLHGGARKTHENSCYDQGQQQPASFQ